MPAAGKSRAVNFSPGPATLPLPVLEEARRHLLALPGVGISILELSHRSPQFGEILDETEANLRQLLSLPAGYRVLFLPGGASLQFSMVPMALVPDGGSADYLITGSWGAKAVKEAAKAGGVRLAWDGSGEGFVRVPEPREVERDAEAAYLHFTSNETIQGVQFHAEPEAPEGFLVCDASSDFLSRPVAVERYGLLYAGAQKNAGPAGVTVVVVREELLERTADGLPSMLDYRIHAAKRSCYNTPPVFAIYLVLLVTRWLLNEVGSLAAAALRNEEKARLLYDAIDSSDGFYRGHARPGSRSRMNVTFRLPSDELEAGFIEEAAAEGLVGLKGHRSVGGLRASIYNAMDLAGVRALADLMDDFRRRHQS